MAPISLFSLIIGKSLIGVPRGMAVSLVFLLLGTVVSPLEFNFLFLLTLLVTCLTFAFLGVFAALLAKSHQDMATFTSLALLPMTFLGGTFFPLEQLPGLVTVILGWFIHL